MWTWTLERCILDKYWTTTSVRFWTPDFCCSFITGSPMSNSVSSGGNFKPGPFCSFTKVKPLSSSVKYVFYKINTSVNTPYLWRSKIITQNQSQSQSGYWNHVAFDYQVLDTENKLPSLSWNHVKFDLPHWNRVNIDHPYKTQVNFDAHTKANRFCGPHPKTESISSTTTTQKQVNRTWSSNHVNCAPHTFNFDLPQKKSHFRAQPYSLVKFDPSHKDEVNFDTTIEIISIRSPRYNQVNFDASTQKPG